MLKEDCQTFDLLVDKAPSFEEASHTSPSLSNAELSDEFYSLGKAGFRNWREVTECGVSHRNGICAFTKTQVHIRAMPPQTYCPIQLSYP